VEQREHVAPGLRAALEDITYPVYHLDFEAFMPAIPRFAGTHPYDAVPFQYSLHIQPTPGDPTRHVVQHVEYLHTQRDAPYFPLASQLVEDLSRTGTGADTGRGAGRGAGSICIYTPYEAGIIRSLASHVPELAEELLALLPRLWDLHPVIRDHYYHPGFHGSFSIKAVVPVLAPDLSYEALEIGDGLAAANTFEASLEMPDGPERSHILESLRLYCGTDTLAMVEARRALARISLTAGRRAEPGFTAGPSAGTLAV
jgi:hypothetical protein